MEPMPQEVDVPDGVEAVPQEQDWYPGMDIGEYFTLI